MQVSNYSILDAKFPRIGNIGKNIKINYSEGWSIKKIVHRFFSRKKEEEERKKEEEKKTHRSSQSNNVTNPYANHRFNDRRTSHVILLAGIQRKSRVARPRRARTHTHTRGQGLDRAREGGGIDIELSATWRQPVTRADVTRLRGPKGRREDDGKVDCPWFTHWWLAQLSCQRATPAALLIHSSRPFHVKLRDSINDAPVVNAFVTGPLQAPCSLVPPVKLSRRVNYPPIVTILFILCIYI